MKKIWLILCCVYTLSGYAQQGTQKGNIDIGNFPEVSFIWNEYNPTVLDSTQFSIKESGIEIAVKVRSLTTDTIPFKPKSILFLWEDQPIRENQFIFTQTLLYCFFHEDIINDTTTTFNVAVFNRKQDDRPVLKPLLHDFISDKTMLKDSVSKYSHDKTIYRNSRNESDLFLAIKEGLDLIGKEPKNNTRAIFVVTAGRNLFVSGVEISPIISQLLQNKIPIYVINYPTPGNETKTVTQLSKETYGQLILSDGNISEQTKTTRVELLKSFNELNRRHYGQDYKITFNSLLKRDGNPYPLLLNSNGVDYNIASYKTPNFSLIIWVKAHLILFLSLLAIVLAAITLGVIFGMKFLKKSIALTKAKKQEEEKRKNQQLVEQENLKRKLNATQEELQRQQRIAEQEKKQVLEQEQDEKYTKLMQIKNLLPRLIVVDEEITFNMSNATITIGRGEDNDIVIPDSTVSKHHAQIVFTGTCFEIYDLASSNGISVNGKYIESTELKSSDTIQLGEVVMKFYL